MNRRAILSDTGALAVAALAGCATDETADADATETGSATATPSTATPTPDEALLESPPVDDERLAELAAGNAAFALDLHAHLADRSEGNVFTSPYSVSAALAMTYAGARGETRAQVGETLRFALGEAVHPAFEDQRTALRHRSVARNDEGDAVYAVRLNLANALWGRQGVVFDDTFLATLEEHYGAGLRRAAFAERPDAERERINGWVAERTEGRIEDLLPPGSITAQTVLVLTNAIYFLAGWAHEFREEETDDATFTALDGSEATVPFMHQTERFHYASVDGVEAVELPYSGREVSMVLLLPEAGTFEEFEQSLDAAELFGLFDALEETSVEVALPRFEFETSVRLSGVLSALGMPRAFTGDAEFGGMVASDGDGPHLSEVYHDSFVAVDEEGTEAAAATAAVTFSAGPSEQVTLRFDRPFLFAIRDRPTDALLFLGRVVDAGAAQGGG